LSALISGTIGEEGVQAFSSCCSDATVHSCRSWHSGGCLSC